MQFSAVYQFMHSLRFEHMTLVLLAPCSTVLCMEQSHIFWILFNNNTKMVSTSLKPVSENILRNKILIDRYFYILLHKSVIKKEALIGLRNILTNALEFI